MNNIESRLSSDCPYGKLSCDVEGIVDTVAVVTELIFGTCFGSTAPGGFVERVRSDGMIDSIIRIVAEYFLLCKSGIDFGSRFFYGKNAVVCGFR